MNGKPICTTFDKVKSGDFDRQGNVIYAIYDHRLHCAYVGQSKSPSDRFAHHESHPDIAELGLLIKHNFVSKVEIFTADMFNQFVDLYANGFDVPDGYCPDPDDSTWANDAETIVCWTLRPYMNRRKTSLSHNWAWAVKYLFDGTTDLLNSLIENEGICESSFWHFVEIAKRQNKELARMANEYGVKYNENAAIAAREKIAQSYKWVSASTEVTA